jgi:hypothetical protein
MTCCAHDGVWVNQQIKRMLTPGRGSNVIGNSRKHHEIVWEQSTGSICVEAYHQLIEPRETHV